LGVGLWLFPLVDAGRGKSVGNKFVAPSSAAAWQPRLRAEREARDGRIDVAIDMIRV